MAGERKFNSTRERFLDSFGATAPATASVVVVVDGGCSGFVSPCFVEV